MVQTDRDRLSCALFDEVAVMGEVEWVDGRRTRLITVRHSVVSSPQEGCAVEFPPNWMLGPF